MDKLHFHVLQDLFDTGDAYLAELEELKAKRKADSSSIDPAKTRPKTKAERDWGSGQTLRERDPW